MDEKTYLPIGTEEVRRATETLRRYNEGKRWLTQKIIKDEEYWKKKQWNYIDAGGSEADRKRGSAWLFSFIESKHADVMDAYPQANFVAKQRDDEQEAKQLTEIVPVILRGCNYEKEYNRETLYALKHGGGGFGIFWNGQKHNGIGDIEIRHIDFLNLYWQAGIEDIQQSPNVFYTSFWDNDILKQTYPKLDDKILGENNSMQAEYIYEDKPDTQSRTLVVDWYYKKVVDKRIVLHLCKYVGETVLFASENDPENYPNGMYEHGMYPFETEPLFPIAGSLCGYGMMDIAGSKQEDVDILDDAILSGVVSIARPRYVFNQSAGINEAEFADTTNTIVHANGNLGEDAFRQISVRDIPSTCLEMRNQYIEEMKQTTANRDVNNGSAGSSVTAASAIAALQESGGKVSRLINGTFYNLHERVMSHVVELIRQFYTMPRVFRITAESEDKYVEYTNAHIRPQSMRNTQGDETGLRKPEFDIEITAERQTAYTKLSNNELMIQLYNLGVFNPQNTEQALLLLRAMDFDQKERIISMIKEQRDVQKLLEYYKQSAVMLAMRYEPQIAQQLMMADAGAQPVEQKTTDVQLSMTEQEPAHMRKARQTVQESTRI